MKPNILKDPIYLIGLCIYIVSVIAFLVTMNHPMAIDSRPFEGIFFIYYGAFIFYFILVLSTNKKRSGKIFQFSSLPHNILLLLIANLSAFALNRDIAVFQISTNWLAVLFALLNAGLIWFSIKKDYAPSLLNFFLVALFSAGVLLGLYGVFYTIPFVTIGVLGCWFFGLSLHIFVPLFWMILLTKIVIKFLKNNKRHRHYAILGLVFPTILAIGFTIRWYQLNHEMKAIKTQIEVPLHNAELPLWVTLSKNLEKSPITEKILKGGMVYTVVNWKGNWFWGMDNSRLNETRKHDPLVVIASFFSPPLEIPKADRLKILNAVFDNRHQTERKLWSGKDLSTQNIVTNVQLFPEYRLAYTEKVITIESNTKRRWRPEQEALYTFYMPEGSVVTSASLWVEGEERPSFLTTRNKADSAYTTIVGRERRDPLLLHWQEGNRVTVRVFPVTPDNPRKFKIGVTSPLEMKENQLVYNNLDFEGPFWKLANETINVVVSGSLSNMSTSAGFYQKEDYWVCDGIYRSDWQLKFDAPKLATDAFYFNGKSYQLLPEKRISAQFEATEIYLDINRSWTKNEFDKIMEMTKDKSVFVHSNKLLKLDETNKDRLFEELQNRQFDLFPFHKIKDSNKALVFTKHYRFTPILEDIKNSSFADNLNQFLAKDAPPIPVFNIGSKVSPYLKTLKEMRSIHLISNNLSNLSAFQDQSILPILKENEAQIALDLADTQILETIGSSNQKTTAPDHLMRLFSYNNLMQKIGKNYFKKERYADELVAEAEEAYVVTPISSLIVLETQADYDRFDIKRGENSLKNASIKDAGSVPEPHEWLLILLCLSVGAFLWWKQ